MEEDILEADYAPILDHDDPPPTHYPIPANGLPSLQTAHRTHVTTTTHVPKAARGPWAQILTAALYSAINDHLESDRNWIPIYIIARCILPARLPGDFSSSYARDVLARIRRWKEGDIGSLWNEAVTLEKKGLLWATEGKAGALPESRGLPGHPDPSSPQHQAGPKIRRNRAI